MSDQYEHLLKKNREVLSPVPRGKKLLGVLLVKRKNVYFLLVLFDAELI